MNEYLLRRKLESIRNAGLNSEEYLSKIEIILKESNPWEIYRINPLSFAKKYNLDQDVTLDFFIHASRGGIFDISWSYVCPKCGGIEHSTSNVNEMQNEKFYCFVCDLDIPAELDDNVEVTFQLNPDIFKFEENIFENQDIYSKFYFSPNYSPHKHYLEYLDKVSFDYKVLNPKSQSDYHLKLKPLSTYRFVSMDLASSLKITTSEKLVENEIVEIVIENDGFKPSYINTNGGNIIFRIKNEKIVQTAFWFVIRDEKLKNEIMKRPTMQLVHPFLTGKMLINSQTFRDIFRIDTLYQDLSLNIRSLTVLFTDLKDSTLLYSNTGDINAYRLIQKHFQVLGSIVKKHKGAIIKTMGDAIMATFAHPHDGLIASIEMLQDISSILIDKKPLGLKIGIHEGPALVINNDGKLDYFGQTVNIAARVQALANEGQIVITNNIFNLPTTKEVLKKYDYQSNKSVVDLKGVNHQITIYICQGDNLSKPLKYNAP